MPDVIIVGYGPVGATAANFLGAAGLDVVVIERDPTPYARARAISTDEDVLRQWQRVGLAERLKADMLGDRPIDFVDRTGKSFLSFTPKPRGNGHPPQMFIYQPQLERVLREGADRYPNVDVRLEHEAGAMRQDADGVELDVTDLRHGSTQVVRARYLLACDGGSSPIRTQLGIGFEGKTYEDPWMASGVRDAGNLCWKLAAVVRGEADDALLDSYEPERQPHVRKVTNAAVFFGRVITERRRPMTMARNLAFAAAMKAPLIGPYLRDGNWFPEPDYRAGLVQAEATKPAGRPIPQPFVATSTEASARLDDVLGETWTVIARPGALARTAHERAEWAAHGAPTFELIDGEPSRDKEIADRDGRLTRFMDEHRVDALVLRPDHFVYAAARAGEPLAPPPALLNPNREIALQEQS